MITWMQRHRKYLIITLWISGGAFIAAGPMFAIGSGSFSGRSADTVAKVGDVEISVHQMNTTYTQLFSQYNQMFKGKFDETQAKAFGLKQQALRQLVNESLLLNLAKSFNLQVADKEVTQALIKTDAFYKNGRFDKETYQKVLKQARLSMSLYEEDLRRSILIGKLMDILMPKALPLEEEAVSTALYVKDKISYKVIDSSDIKIDPKTEELKTYWQKHKTDYMTEPSYLIEAIEQKAVSTEYNDNEIDEAYKKNKHSFVKENGEIKSLEEAKDDVVALLNKEATNKEALRTYIKYKKGKLDNSVPKQKFTVSKNKNIFGSETFKKISSLTTAKPYLKPQEINGKFMIFKLVENKASEPKTFKEALKKVKSRYEKELTKTKLQELAKNSLATFNGKTSEFLTRESITKLAPLNEYEAAEFLNSLFMQQNKRGYIELKGNKIVLFNILEQKLLNKPNNEQGKNVLRLKTNLLDDGLLKKLETEYPVTSYLEGK